MLSAPGGFHIDLQPGFLRSMNRVSPHQIDFLKSALAFDSPISPNASLTDWILQRRSSVKVRVEKVDLGILRQWSIDSNTGYLSHYTGRFFSIVGIRVRTNWGQVHQWDQPIINQAEVGYLGFIAKKFENTLHLLVQAKIEPGNANIVQLSPTLQATKSNYTQAHRGARPRYLEYFNGEIATKVLVDQLQSEQGARFLRKRNRNIVSQVRETEDVPITDDFRWLTIGQLKRLMARDSVVNMDSRTVLSCLGFGYYSDESLRALYALAPRTTKGQWAIDTALNGERAHHDFSTILSWISGLKAAYDLEVLRIPLHAVKDWEIGDQIIQRTDKKYFSVIGVKTEIANREVTSWDQPMIEPAQEGLVAFLVKPINGVLHFLVQAKLEPGNFDVIELAPTVQCLTGNYRIGQNEYSVPYIHEVLEAPKDQILFDSMQSEEGGRFFREENRSMIVMVDELFPIDTYPNFCWMTLNQMYRFVEFNNYLNISARSLMACFPFA